MHYSGRSGGVCHANLRHLHTNLTLALLFVLLELGPGRELVRLELPGLAHCACPGCGLVCDVESLRLVVHVDDGSFDGGPLLLIVVI